MKIAQDRSDFHSAGKRALPWLAAGAALAAAAVVVRQRIRQEEADHPLRGHVLEVEGVRLHYIERGQGQPVILLHGNGDMAEGFALSSVLDHLAAAGYRVIAFDRPGYGYSERPSGHAWTPSEQADLLHRAMLQLGIEHAVVAGHSWGTFVALRLALKYPSVVDGLLLMSGYYYPTFRLDVPQLSVPALPIVGNLLRYTVSPLIGRLMWPAVSRRIFAPASVHPRFSRFPVWLNLRPRQLLASAAESAMMIPAARALAERYDELAMPVALMAGDGDKHVNTRRQTMRLHGELQGSELRIVPGAGHMFYYVAQQEIVAAIDSLAQRAAQAPGVWQNKQAQAVLSSAGTVGI